MELLTLEHFSGCVNEPFATRLDDVSLEFVLVEARAIGTGATPHPGGNEVPGSELGDEQTTTPPLRPTDANLDGEHRQALEQWLQEIPDNPGELLRRKFWYEQQQHQDKTR